MVNISQITRGSFVQKSSVQVISVDGIKKFPVQTTTGISLKEDVDLIAETIDQIILKLEVNLKSESHIKLLKKKLFLDSGGLNGTFLIADLLKFDNEKKLFISIYRDGDISANTSVLYWIKCPEEVNQGFKDFLKSALRKNILEICESLFIRSSARTQVIPFYGDLRKRLTQMN